MKRHVTKENAQIVNEHIKIASMSWAIRKMQIKITVSKIIYWKHKMLAKIWETGSLIISSENIKWHSHSGDSAAVSLKTTHTQPNYQQSHSEAFFSETRRLMFIKKKPSQTDS